MYRVGELWFGGRAGSVEEGSECVDDGDLEAQETAAEFKTTNHGHGGTHAIHREKATKYYELPC